MNKFQVNVEPLQEAPAELDIEAAPRELELESEGYSFPSPVHIRMSVRMAGHDVRGTGEIETETETACARCLEPVRHPLRAEVDNVWLHKDPDRPDRYQADDVSAMAEYYSGDSINVRNAVREVLLSSLPELEHCRPDCKGLCPGCGANLNREACRCATKQRPEDAEPSDWKRALERIKPSLPS